MKSNKTFIILSSIFLGVALTAFLFELYANYGALQVIRDVAQQEKQTLGQAIGNAISVGVLYFFTVFAGIISLGLCIPVVPFSIIMLNREKNAPYAIAFLVLATMFIVLAIGVMFIVPLRENGASQAASSYSSSY